MKKGSRFNIRHIFLIFGIVIAVLLSVAWYIFGAGPGTQSILLNGAIDAETVYAGEPFDVLVQFGNESRSMVTDVEISLQIPEGVVFVDNLEQRIVRSDIGDIAIGGLHEEGFSLMAIPLAEGSTQKVIVRAQYSLGPLSARFEKQTEIDIPVARTGFQVSISGPDGIYSGERITMEAQYGRVEGDYFSRKADAFSDVRVVLLMPDSFVRQEVMPATEGAAYEWELGSLKNGDEGSISVVGNFQAPDNTSINVIAQMQAELFGESYVVAEDVITFYVKQSPLSLSVSVNKGIDASYSPGERISYTLRYANNTDMAFKDVSLRVALSGEMIDLDTFEFSGEDPHISASRRELVWDGSMIDVFAELPPREMGRIDLTISLRDTYPIVQLSDKNFSVSLDGWITSSSVPDFLAAHETIGRAQLETKVRGTIAVEAFGLFRDPNARIVNSGPFPPQVGQPTEYTIHWKLKNYSTDVERIVVRAQLQEGVIATGVSKSNTSIAPQVHSESGEIVWEIDRLVATTGVLSSQPEAIFQVQAVPRENQAGAIMPLLGTTTVTAYDEFTGAELRSIAGMVTTELPADTTTTSGQGKVR